jgi:hypothetical protein
MLTAENIQNKTLSQLSSIVYQDWKKVNFAAAPYLSAFSMFHTLDLGEQVGYDSAKSVVLYFLSNSGSWRGDTAKIVKTELKRRLRAIGYKI